MPFFDAEWHLSINMIILLENRPGKAITVYLYKKIFVTEKQFIFSNERKYRLIRHLSFWIAFSIVCFVTGSYPYRPEDLLTSQFYIISLIWVACFLPVSVLFSYLFLKFVLPIVSKKRNFFKIFLAICIASLINITISCLLNRMAISRYDATADKEILKENLQLTYYHSIVFTFLLASLITIITVIKNWYLQIAENTKLYKQKIYTELNVLKSQVYPAFLFNSLTILRNQLDRSTAEAAKLLLSLSDILSYILYDSGRERVLLKKEIVNIKNYIEVIKHSGVSDITTEEYVSFSDKYIPPLILFSLLETVLSEINTQTSRSPRIHISICEKNNFIEFKISCEFEGSLINESFPEKTINKIRKSIKKFPLSDQKLIIIKNERNIEFSILIEIMDSVNFSKNELYFQK